MRATNGTVHKKEELRFLPGQKVLKPVDVGFIAPLKMPLLKAIYGPMGIVKEEKENSADFGLRVLGQPVARKISVTHNSFLV